MKYATSALLCETIAADGVEYDDCARFQLMCPACNEAIFKAVRDGDAPIHYFSHYRKDKALVQECELRVGALELAEIERLNKVARGQTLAFYLRVLRKEVAEQQGGTTFHREMADVERSKTCRDMRNIVLANLQSNQAAFDILVEAGQATHTFPTAFSLAKQIEIARAIWKQLLSDTGRDNLKWLFNVGVLSFHSFLITRDEAGKLEEDGKLYAYAMPVIISGGARRGAEAYNDLYELPAPSGENRAVALQKHIALRMVMVLLELDYLKMLKDFRAQKFGRTA